MNRKVQLIITLILPVVLTIFWSFFTVAILTDDIPGSNAISDKDLPFYAKTAILAITGILSIYLYVTYRWIEKLEDKSILAVTIPMSIINVAYIIYRYIDVSTAVVILD